jgi:hypothetical protein
MLGGGGGGVAGAELRRKVDTSCHIQVRGLRGQSQGPVWGCFGGPYIGTYCWLGVVGRSYRLERYPKHPPRAAACSFWVGRAMRPLTATERVPAAAL